MSIIIIEQYFLSQVADLKNKLEAEKGQDAYPKTVVKLIYAGKYMYRREFFIVTHAQLCMMWSLYGSFWRRDHKKMFANRGSR